MPQVKVNGLKIGNVITQTMISLSKACEIHASRGNFEKLPMYTKLLTITITFNCSIVPFSFQCSSIHSFTLQNLQNTSQVSQLKLSKSQRQNECQSGITKCIRNLKLFLSKS